MIDRVVIRRFKQFKEVTFELRGRHLVLVGPNNGGKTTVLQAIAAWGFALQHWRSKGDLSKHFSAFSRVPVARPDFLAVPLKRFELLWHEQAKSNPIEIEIRTIDGRVLAMELEHDSTEQIYVRP